jgi:hypothetical protein
MNRTAAGRIVSVEPSDETTVIVAHVEGRVYSREAQACKMILSSGEEFILPGGAREPLSTYVGECIRVTQFEDGETRIFLDS